MPLFNPKRLASHYLKAKVKDALGDFLDGVGPERTAHMISQGINFDALVQHMPKDQQEQLFSQVKANGWVARAITDEEFAALLPDWLQRLVGQQEDQGAKWLDNQVKWLRSLFKEEQII